MKKEKCYFTVVGFDSSLGEVRNYLKPGMKVKLVKEPDNDYDKEAIKVCLEGLGQIGYVANSVYTVIYGDSMSAGRLYDKFDNNKQAEVVHVFEKNCICCIN